MSGDKYEIFQSPSTAPYSMIVEWNARYLRGPNIGRPDHLRSPFWHPREPSTVEDDQVPEPHTALFRLMDLPFEIRKEIFYQAISSPDSFWIDRQVITFGKTIQDIKISNFGSIRERIVWRDSNGVFLCLLLCSRQICHEVKEMFYGRIAFDACGWGYTMKQALCPTHPISFPKHQIKHIVYTLTLDVVQMTGEHVHRESARRIISGLPTLCSVRIMATWQCRQDFPVGITSRYIVTVARLFHGVGKVAVVGKSLTSLCERKSVEDARKELKYEPWYWELKLDYPIVSALPDSEEFL